MSMLEKDDNVSDNFGSYEDGNSILKVQEIKGDHKYLISKSSDTWSYTRAGGNFQDWLFEIELSSSLKKFKFGKKEFLAGISISNIKYDHPGSQNDNLFYAFYN